MVNNLTSINEKFDIMIQYLSDNWELTYIIIDPSGPLLIYRHDRDGLGDNGKVKVWTSIHIGEPSNQVIPSSAPQIGLSW